MRKFLVTLCSVALIAGTIAPMPVMAAAGDEVYDFDGDIIDNPWGDEFATEAPVTAPKITVQPSNVTAAKGEVVKMTIGAEGTDLKYQWQMSTDKGATWTNTTASGATTATLTFTMSASLDGRMVRCIVTNSAGQAISNAATISAVTDAIKITVQPSDIATAVGRTVRLSTGAEGEGLTYQWQISADGGKTWSNSAASGAKSAMMSFTMSKNLDGRLARCIITDANGNSVVTRSAKVEIGTPIDLSITAQPKNVVATVGDIAYVEVDAKGTGVMYRWQISTDNGKTWKNSTASGYNTKLMTFKMTSNFVGRQVRCVVSDANLETVYSDVVTVSLGVGELKVLSQPVDVSGSVGSDLRISVLASGTGLTYQWQISSNNGATWSNSTASGAKTASMGFKMSNNLNGRIARCIITDVTGKQVITESAKVSLD